MPVKSKEGKFLGLFDRIKKIQVARLNGLNVLLEEVFLRFLSEEVGCLFHGLKNLLFKRAHRKPFPTQAFGRSQTGSVGHWYLFFRSKGSRPAHFRKDTNAPFKTSRHDAEKPQLEFQTQPVHDPRALSAMSPLPRRLLRCVRTASRNPGNQNPLGANARAERLNC